MRCFARSANSSADFSTSLIAMRGGAKALVWQRAGNEGGRRRKSQQRRKISSPPPPVGTRSFHEQMQSFQYSLHAMNVLIFLKAVQRQSVRNEKSKASTEGNFKNLEGTQSILRVWLQGSLRPLWRSEKKTIFRTRFLEMKKKNCGMEGVVLTGAVSHFVLPSAKLLVDVSPTLVS